MFLFLIILLMPSISQADCVGKVLSVSQDEKFGTVLVKTEYKIDGAIVQLGETRYDENSIDVENLIDKDISDHCKTLIMRLPSNQEFITEKILDRQKSLTSSMVSNLQSKVGVEVRETVNAISYKGITINVQTDSKLNSVNNF